MLILLKGGTLILKDLLFIGDFTLHTHIILKCFFRGFEC